MGKNQTGGESMAEEGSMTAAEFAALLITRMKQTPADCDAYAALTAWNDAQTCRGSGATIELVVDTAAALLEIHSPLCANHK